ncbi:MAG: hypothetical protein GXO89_07115 [Chlorobi bacterium]|nr:hypothetical protein [Chlorobiota bacterium]
MKFLYHIAVFLIMLFWQMVANGQVDATARLDTNAILVGDQLHLDMEINFPADYTIHWPEYNDTVISKIEVLGKSAVDTVLSEDKSRLSLKQRLLITCFDSGYYAIPPVHFIYTVPNDTVRHFEETDAMLLQVSTIAVDTTQAIKDIRAPLAAPVTFKEMLPYLLIGLAVLIIAALLIYYLRKRKKEEPVFRSPPKPKLPPQQIALTALDDLRLKKLWQSGQVKDYHTELTDIVRNYLEGKFDINAMEMTTDEIMESLKIIQVNAQAKDKIRKVFQLADLVKFAKQQPLPLEHDASLNNAVDFVKESMHLNTARPAVEVGKKEVALPIGDKVEDKKDEVPNELGESSKTENKQTE